MRAACEMLSWPRPGGGPHCSAPFQRPEHSHVATANDREERRMQTARSLHHAQNRTANVVESVLRTKSTNPSPVPSSSNISP